jgi:2'-5' RNA ligase
MGGEGTLGMFGIPRLAAAERMRGLLGLVLQPDTATIRASYALAAALIGEDAEQVVAPGSLPHLTLTQCAVGDVPRSRLAMFVERLRARLCGRTIPLTTIAVFGGGFVFWCVDPSSPERRLLANAHEDAVLVADGFLDHVANAAVVDATARATGGDPDLVDNARRYGYAFARDHYVPHITLGFDRRFGAAGGRRFEAREERHAMIVADVLVAKLGPLGRVAAVLSLPDQPRS